MAKYFITFILLFSFAPLSYACGCMPIDQDLQPPTKYISYTITKAETGNYIAYNKRKGLINFTKSQITDNNQLFVGDIILAKETNDKESRLLGIELFIPHDQLQD